MGDFDHVAVVVPLHRSGFGLLGNLSSQHTYTHNFTRLKTPSPYYCLRTQVRIILYRLIKSYERVPWHRTQSLLAPPRIDYRWRASVQFADTASILAYRQCNHVLSVHTRHALLHTQRFLSWLNRCGYYRERH